MTDPFRTKYRALSDPEKLALQIVKDAASEMLATLHRHCTPGRETSLAVTKLEECVMWAVKGITG